MKWAGMEFHSYGKIVPDAYHGTLLDSAKSIVTEGFKPSSGEKQYLGDGVYFFEASHKNAEKWIKNRCDGKPYAVMSAVINLGNCLDLFNWEHRKFLENVRHKLLKSGEITKASDAAVINFIVKNFSPVDSVRAIYVGDTKRKIFRESRLLDYVQVIICVNNVNNILNYKICNIYS